MLSFLYFTFSSRKKGGVLGASQGAQTVKNLPPMQETQVMRRDPSSR